MTFLGLTSWSLDRSAAENFARSNQRSGTEATLFYIVWKKNSDYFLMDFSAFPDEKEVIIFDREQFEVEFVEQTVEQNGNPLNLIVLKSY